MNIDSLTFNTSKDHDRWVTVCPQLDVRCTAKTRVEAIAACTDKAFKRFYELDAERHYSVNS